MTKIFSQNQLNHQNSRKMKKVSSSSSLSTQSNFKTFISKKRIPEQNKKNLIYLITKCNYSLKNAAVQTNISYSTAKKLYNELKKSLKPKQSEINEVFLEQNKIRCSFRSIEIEQRQERIPIVIFSTIGGFEQQQ